MTAEAPTRALAEFAAGLSTDAIPARVLERVKDLFLDALASALAGYHAEEPKRFLAVARILLGAGESTVIGNGSLSMGGATLVNGCLISAVTLCDFHRATSCHVSPEVVPPALAIAERNHATGSDLLVAMAAGFELTTRVGLGINYRAFRARGWNTPGVTGVFGAAASAGSLLRLGPVRMNHALGIAASQAAGSYAHKGTPAIKFTQSRAALGGLMAAQLAEQGITAAEEPLTHQDGGLYRTHSDGGNPAAAVEGLGKVWELENISLRPWPVGARLQTLAGGLLDLVAAENISPELVGSITVSMSPSAYRLHGEMDWENRFRAKLSARYLVSVIVHDRACWLDQFTAERIADARVREFAAEKVEIRADPQLSEPGVAIHVSLLDGRSLNTSRQIPHGDVADPLAREEIASKFRRASSDLLSPDQATRVIDLVATLEKCRELGPLFAGVRGLTASD